MLSQNFAFYDGLFYLGNEEQGKFVFRLSLLLKGHQQRVSQAHAPHTGTCVCGRMDAFRSVEHHLGGKGGEGPQRSALACTAQRPTDLIYTQ